MKTKNTAQWGKDKAQDRVKGYKRGGAVKVTININKKDGVERPVPPPMLPVVPPAPPPGVPPVPPGGGAPPFARGGRMTAGAETGKGRLQKARIYGGKK